MTDFLVIGLLALGAGLSIGYLHRRARSGKGCCGGCAGCGMACSKRKEEPK